MKRLFVIDKYFPYGGLQRDFLAVVTAALARGDEVHVATLSWEGEVPSGVIVHCCQTRAFSNVGRLMALARDVQRVSRQLDLDGIVGFKKMPGLAVYFMGEELFSTRLNAAPWRRLLSRYRQYAKLEAAVFSPKGHTHIFHIDEASKREAIAVFGTQASRFHRLAPGVERVPVPLSQREAVRKKYRRQLGVAEHLQLGLFVASNYALKGLGVLIEALAMLPKTVQQHCVILVAGDDNPAGFIALAEQYRVRDRIQFLGPRDDVSELMASADLLIHPAKKEPGGKVLLEALMSGLPVLASSCCGYAHYIHQAKSGVIADFSSAELLAAAWINSIEHLSKYQEAANAYAATQAFDQFPTQFLHYLDQVGA